MSSADNIHKYNTLTRTTPDGGQFVQLAISSIFNALDQLVESGEVWRSHAGRQHHVRSEPGKDR
jgi:hypothetical protein